MIYVALLRGINVGGNNKISMKLLTTTFKELGLKNVKTYINSGNIIFSDATHSPQKLVEMLHTAIKKDFGIEIKVLIRDLKNIEALTKSLPSTWINNDSMKCDVLFLSDEIDSSKVLDQLVITSGVDEVKYVKGAVLWCIDRADINRSGLLKIVGTQLYKQMTIRNCNTVRRLEMILQSAEV